MRVLVMGLGLHGGGLGSANYFLERGAVVTVTDLKPERELHASVAKLRGRERVRLVLGRHDFEDFRDTDLVIKNPAVPPGSPYLRHAREHGVRVETDIGLFLDVIREKTTNIVGVTGTKGKSTTATLIHGIFMRHWPDAVLGGNITVSVLDLVERVREGAYVVLELSSFQLGGIRDKRYSPRIAVFTNFLEDHLNYYRSMEEYFRDKAVIFENQRERDVLLVNRDDPFLSGIAPPPGVQRFTFGPGERFDGKGSFVRAGKIYVRDGEGEHAVMEVGAVKLPGEHNLANVLAAVAAAWFERVPTGDIAEAVSSFTGIPHRMEYLGSWHGLAFYNDTAATMPDAAVRGVRCFDCPLTLIAGGADKGLQLERFVEAINERVRTLVLLEGSGTARLLGAGRVNVPHRVFDNIRDAFTHACASTPPSGAVLLSPGFASFGMFQNEFDRGNQFKGLVAELLEGRVEKQS